MKKTPTPYRPFVHVKSAWERIQEREGGVSAPLFRGEGRNKGREKEQGGEGGCGSREVT